MKVVKREPVPIYRAKCPECKSETEYQASEVMACHIYCPVCHVFMWAHVINPVRYEWMGTDKDEPPEGEDDAE